MDGIALAALDGTNPLAFFAALGTLAAADELTDAGAPVRLWWSNEGLWIPRIDVGDADLIDMLEADLQTWKDDPALALEYDKGDGKRVKDLKPPPEVFREFLLARRVRSRVTARRPADFATAFATDVAVDNSGNTKPTALHFTAGQQLFGQMVGELAESVCRADLEEALHGPWRYESTLPTLGWDASVNRDYALRAGDPSKEKKTSVPGAEWLAFRALSFFQTVPVGRRVVTTACHGRWKSGSLLWPLWTVPMTQRSAATLLRYRSLDQLSSQEREERGIAIVLRAGILRSSQGGYGGFQPAQVV